MILLTHITRCRTPSQLTRHHFHRGQAWGRILSDRGGSLDNLDGYVTRRLDFIDDCVKQWGGDVADHYLEAKYLIRLGVASAWLGAYFELAIHTAMRSLNAAKETSLESALKSSNIRDYGEGDSALIDLVEQNRD